MKRPQIQSALLKDLKRLLAAAFIFLLFGSITVFGAESDFRFDSWTTDNGLPQASINSILQTRDGFLWIATFGGLVRYDGLRFEVFNTGNTPGLKTGRFSQLFEDNDGSLWISTEGQGVSRYKDGEFRTYTKDDGLPRNLVDAFFTDSEGRLQLAFGADTFSFDGNTFNQTSSRPTISGDSIIFRGPDGSIWYRSGTRLIKNENGFDTQSVDVGSQSRRVYDDLEGKFWLVGQDDHIYSLKDGTLSPVMDQTGNFAAGFLAISADRDKNIWYSSRGGSGGLVLFKDGKFSTFTTADGLINNNVQTVYQDREGTIWVGTAGGLSRMTRKVISTYSVDDGLAGENVYPILEDRSGKVWIGSAQGLTTYENGKFENVGARYGLDKDWVTSLYQDTDGTIWIGTWASGVRHISGKVIETFSTDQMGGSRVRAILRGPDGDIWFGIFGGLARIHNGAFEKFTTQNGLADDSISALMADSKGRLWIGTNLGVSIYENGAFRSAGDGIEKNNVRSFYGDGDGTIWIGMYDSGIYRFKNGEFKHITVNQGLFDNGAFNILEDGKNNLWISCNLGIFRVRKDELNDVADGRTQKVSSIPYNRRDGMLNSECNGGGQPAGVKTRDGHLWFPTQKGVAVIDPDRVPFNFAPPPVVIEAINIDSHPVPIRQKIVLEHDQTNLELHYSGLSFINPELVKFKYRLDGLDKDWIDASTRRTAYYPHLPAGNYTFTVLAANRDGVWNEVGASVTVYVKPAFWNTWWFRTIFAILLVILVYGIYRFRIGQLQQAHSAREEFARQLIESQEQERKRIAAELHDSLGQSLVLIKNWALMGTKALAPEQNERANLGEITETASDAIEEVREIAYNLGPYQLERLGLRKTIGEMVQKVAASSRIDFRAEIAEIEGCLSRESEISLFRIVQEGISNIVRHSDATEAMLTIALEKPTLRVTLVDNGKGFDIETTGKGFGLFGMAERVRFMRGEFAVRSEPRKGTKVSITLPITAKNG